LVSDQQPGNALESFLCVTDIQYSTSKQPPPQAVAATRLSTETLMRLTPLPESAQLGTEIEQAYRGAGGHYWQPISGVEATESRLINELDRGRQHVFIYTHGFYQSPQSISQALRDSGQRAQEPPPQDAKVTSYDLFSGIALAGALDAPSEDDASDNLLLAEEIKALDLSDTDLVVLSACVTGLGRLVVGDGVTGFQRSFFLARANTMVTSQWPVDHFATMELMRQFYTNLFQKRMSKLEALCEAQRELIRSGYEHPRFWGAWTLSGAPGHGH